MTVKRHTIQLLITNSYLLVGDAGRAVLVDGGLVGTARQLAAGLARVDVDPRSIELVLITHSHFDHSGSAAAIRELTGAALAVHTSEADRVETGRKVMPAGRTNWGRALRIPFGGLVRALRLPPCPVDLRIDDELDLTPYGVAGRVIHTPGHSPGSLTVVTEDGAAFVGDMAMNGPPLTLKPELPIFAERPDELANSWGRIISAGAETIFPAHGRPFPASDMRSVLGIA